MHRALASQDALHGNWPLTAVPTAAQREPALRGYRPRNGVTSASNLSLVYLPLPHKLRMVLLSRLLHLLDRCAWVTGTHGVGGGCGKLGDAHSGVNVGPLAVVQLGGRLLPAGLLRERCRRDRRRRWCGRPRLCQVRQQGVILTPSMLCNSDYCALGVARWAAYMRARARRVVLRIRQRALALAFASSVRL